MEHLFDFLYKPDPDAWKWRLVSTVAGCGAFFGIVLIAEAHLRSVGGIASGLGGLALLAGSVLGFRHYWRNL